jgi:integrase
VIRGPGNGNVDAINDYGCNVVNFDDEGRRNTGELTRGSAIGKVWVQVAERAARAPPDRRRGDLQRPGAMQGTRAEIRLLDWLEVEQLALETIEPCGKLVRFACLTGLRQGELFALRNRALDHERRSIVVEAGANDE